MQSPHENSDRHEGLPAPSVAEAALEALESAVSDTLSGILTSGKCAEASESCGRLKSLLLESGQDKKAKLADQLGSIFNSVETAKNADLVEISELLIDITNAVQFSGNDAEDEHQDYRLDEPDVSSQAIPGAASAPIEALDTQETSKSEVEDVQPVVSSSPESDAIQPEIASAKDDSLDVLKNPLTPIEWLFNDSDSSEPLVQAMPQERVVEPAPAPEPPAMPPPTEFSAPQVEEMDEPVAAAVPEEVNEEVDDATPIETDLHEADEKPAHEEPASRTIPTPFEIDTVEAPESQRSDERISDIHDEELAEVPAASESVPVVDAQTSQRGDVVRFADDRTVVMLITADPAFAKRVESSFGEDLRVARVENMDRASSVMEADSTALLIVDIGDNPDESTDISARRIADHLDRVIVAGANFTPAEVTALKSLNVRAVIEKVVRSDDYAGPAIGGLGKSA